MNILANPGPFLLALLTLCPLAANAQDPTPFLGNWQARWESERRPQEARVRITETGGSWQTLASRRHQPCNGKEAPIALEKIGPETAILRLKFSEALAGCQDGVVHLKRITPNRMSGKRGEYEIEFTRE